MTPAGETPFAKDAHFGFSASNLRDWVVEKSGGTIIRQNVTSVSLRDIREGGHAAVANILESQVQGNTVVINGESIFTCTCISVMLFIRNCAKFWRNNIQFSV